MKVAFPTNNQKTIAKHIGLSKGFLIVDTDTNEKIYIPNPIMEEIQEKHLNLKDMPEGSRGFGTGRIIPSLLKEHGAEALVADEFGEGMLNNLNIAGITPIETEEKDIENVISQIKEDNMEILQNSSENFSNPYDAPEFGRGMGFGPGRGFGRRQREFGRRRFGGGFGNGFGSRRGGGGFGRGRQRGFGFRRGWDD